MSGFHHDELADVNLITDNLRDRYKDQFSILKELVQNADDARAHNLRFGLFAADEGNSHSLLRGPGLVAVNDGPFTDSDFRAICSFGLNSKAGDLGTIGKYGLGMKSIFHLGEAFFFVAESQSRIYKELLTPWGQIRSDWDISEEQWSKELPSLRRNWLGAVQWVSDSAPFILYVPLRQKAHLQLPDGRTAGAIIENYPGDDHGLLTLMSSENTWVRLTSLLPLLRDLDSIQVYIPGDDGSPRRVHSCEVDQKSIRPLREHRPGDSELRAAIATRGQQVLSAGWQRFRFTETLQRLHVASAWPASWIRDGLQERRVPDKAQPHAAAVFMRDTKPGNLTIRWAVFLPVDEHDETVEIDPGMGGYCLTLHGHFFADAGRNGLYGLDDSGNASSFPTDEARIRREWNVALAEGSTLDLVLPALRSFCQTSEMAENRVAALTGALKNSQMWAKRKAAIGANHKWLRLATPEGFHWALISDERALPLPAAPDKDPGRPWRVFPGLAGLGNHVVLFDPSADNLVARDSDLGSWDEDEAVALMARIDVARTFDSSVDADYAARFLEQLTVLQSDIVQRELRALLRRAVQALGLERLRGIAASVSRIATLIPRERKLRITMRNTSIAEVLILQDTEALPWPKELDTGEASPEADLHTLQALVTALAGYTSHADACRLYAQELLSGARPETRSALLKRVGDLAVLSAFDCRTRQRVSVSGQFMAECRKRQTLFRTGQGLTDSDRAELGTLLQGVLPKEAVLVVSKEVAGLVLGPEEAEEILPCNAKGVLSCLGHSAHELGDVASRRELLHSLKLPDRDPTTLRGMRFLLHGAPENFDRNDQLWTGRGKVTGAWRKLWEAVNAPEFRWTVIDPTLADLITPADQDALNLHGIEPEQVVKVVAERGGPAVLDLNGNEYETILGYAHWAEEAWKCLPAHLTSQGNRVPIGDMTYLAGSDAQMPAELLQGVTIIQQSATPAVRDLQLRWIPELDLRAAVTLALKTDRPEVWCNQILDWLDRLKKEDRQAVWPAILYSTVWLKLRSGGALSPDKLIVLPEAESQITELARASAHYATPSMLAEGLSGHPALDLLRDRAGNLATLYSMLRDLPGGALGNIELKLEFIRPSADIMRSCPDGSACGWRLIARLCTAYGHDVGQSAFYELARPLPGDRLKAILKWLPEVAGSENLFLAFLAVFAKAVVGPGDLRGVRLRTVAGVWKAAQEICIDVPGVDASYLLCKEHREPLGDLVRRNPPHRTIRANQDLLGPSVEKVREYFSSWLGRSSAIRAQVGVLVTLLAGTTRLNVDAAEMLAPHTREWVLSQIPWSNDWTDQPLNDLTLQEAISFCTVHFSEEEITEISCLSITDDLLIVPAEKKPASLLAGRPQLRWAQIDQKKVSYDVTFRTIDINPICNAELSSVLQATAEGLIRWVYQQARADLSALWAKLDQTEHLHLETAEKLILEYLPFYLGQIRPTGVPVLSRKLGEIEELRRLRIEYSGDPAKAKEYEAQRAALGRMLNDNDDLQRAVLEGLRARLRDLEYQESSIAFEVFQNADDAYIQSGDMSPAGDANPQRKNRFVVLLEDEALTFLHWGRPINYVGPSGYNGRQRGYHRDLERMLTLAGSDKQHLGEAGSRVTGKFGLGFKSALLACDRPEVASAGLEFEIRAGVLPHLLSAGQAEHLRSVVQQWSGLDPTPGTALRLPGVKDSSLVLDDFYRNAGCLCALSSSIREISIVTPGQRYDAAWDGRTVAGNVSIQAGSLQFGNEAVSALRIDVDEAVALFGLGPEGITDLPRETPSVWVTCPTHEDQHFGFAVCGKFHVDTGRARLSRNVENETEALRIGTLLSQRLRELRHASWETIRCDLRLAQTTTEYDFWASLWRLYQRTVKQPESAVAAILKPILTRAIKALSNELAVVPNGLPGAARVLTTGPKLRHKMTGALGVDGAVEPLLAWPEWNAHDYTPDTLISQANSAGLQEIGLDRVVSISLASVASWMARKIASPADATAFGSVLHALPKREDRTQEITEDLRRAEQTLKEVQFRSEGRTSERVSDLVTAAFREDEARRAAFAPANRRLSPEYDEPAREFFRFCRGPIGIGADDLAQWIRQAEDPAARRAALTYLVRGDLGLQVQRQLAALGTDGTWLAALSADELPLDLRNDLLRPAVQLRSYSPVTLRVADPRASLARIEQWWRRNAAGELDEYNRRVYPHGRIPRLKAPWQDDFDRSDRSEWLVLFGRAAFYRAGRATDAQHRGFIEMSQRHGFWSIYAAEDPKARADEWMNVLEQFCDDQVDSDTWEHWMRFFPHLYKLSRWLKEYAELFLGLQDEADEYDLDTVLTSRADPGQRGGGISAPPPSLGIGACFVIRELLRFGHLESSSARRHAFVPSRGVRELVLRLGLKVDNTAEVAVSNQIYEELARYLDPERLDPDRVTFGMAFDIPFQIIAANPDLEQKLVWEPTSGEGA